MWILSAQTPRDLFLTISYSHQIALSIKAFTKASTNTITSTIFINLAQNFPQGLLPIPSQNKICLKPSRILTKKIYIIENTMFQNSLSSSPFNLVNSSLFPFYFCSYPMELDLFWISHQYNLKEVSVQNFGIKTKTQNLRTLQLYSLKYMFM